MKALIFDPFSGASGDMILGSLVDIGVEKLELIELMESVADVDVAINEVKKKGIKCVDVNIKSSSSSNMLYFDLIDYIKSCSLDKLVEESALGIFSLLADAESEIHGMELEDLHFHEVGQQDAIADIIGACHALKNFECEKIFTTPISVGSGYVEASHGRLPVPAPVTLKILENCDMRFSGGGLVGEYLTPTGAAILGYFAQSVNSYPQSKPIKSGYGSGDKETNHPNLLRSLLVEVEDFYYYDQVELLETNVDDVTGEVLGHMLNNLITMGAKDATLTPTLMKKGRPGHKLQVICHKEESFKIAKYITEEIGTLGIRVVPTYHRFILNRKIIKIDLDIKSINYGAHVKIARDKLGNLVNVSAEFEDCKHIALMANVPVKNIMRLAEEEAWKVVPKKEYPN